MKINLCLRCFLIDVRLQSDQLISENHIIQVKNLTMRDKCLVAFLNKYPQGCFFLSELSTRNSKYFTQDDKNKILHIRLITIITKKNEPLKKKSLPLEIP